jgi:hypothetical protein
LQRLGGLYRSVQFLFSLLQQSDFPIDRQGGTRKSLDSG